MSEKRDPPEVIRKFGLAMSMGIVFISSVLAGGIVGYYLDDWLGTAPLMLMIFFFIGTGGAIYNVFKIAARMN